MKKFFISILAFSTLAILSCKKSDTNTSNTTTSRSTWTYNGVTYQTERDGFTDCGNYLIKSGANKGESIDVGFSRVSCNSQARPNAGTFNVVPYFDRTTSTTPNQCFIQGNILNGNGGFNSITITNNAKVTISYSSDGKVIANFSNVIVKDQQTNTNKTVTGNLIEQ